MGTATEQSEAILEAIRTRKKELIAELNELETAERVYKSLNRNGESRSSTGPVNTAASEVEVDSTPRRQPSLVLGRDALVPNQDTGFNKTMRQATLEILASVSDRGISAQSLRASLENMGWTQVKSTSLASLLTRLKNEGVVDNLNRRWMLSENAKASLKA